MRASRSRGGGRGSGRAWGGMLPPGWGGHYFRAGMRGMKGGGRTDNAASGHGVGRSTHFVRFIPLIPLLPSPYFKLGRASGRGKSVSVRVDIGGRRFIKKTKNIKNTII